MSFLLDTNILSQTLKPSPNQAVIHWLHDNRNATMFISVISVAEVRRGIEMMPVGKRRLSYNDWLENDLPRRFQGRILPVDANVADAAGRLSAMSRQAGFTIEPFDILIAATAHVHQLTVATLNRSHFLQLGATLADI